LPRLIKSEAENFSVKGGMAMERPQPREQDAMKAPAAKREERWRKSRRSITDLGWAAIASLHQWDGWVPAMLATAGSGQEAILPLRIHPFAL
jgi:hypothetical protein